MKTDRHETNKGWQKKLTQRYKMTSQTKNKKERQTATATYVTCIGASREWLLTQLTQRSEQQEGVVLQHDRVRRESHLDAHIGIRIFFELGVDDTIDVLHFTGNSTHWVAGLLTSKNNSVLQLLVL